MGRAVAAVTAAAHAGSHGEQVTNSLPNMQRKNIHMASFLPLSSLSTDINSEHRRRFIVMVPGFSFSFPLQASHEPPLSVPVVCSSRTAKRPLKCIIRTCRETTVTQNTEMIVRLFSPPSLLSGATVSHGSDRKMGTEKCCRTRRCGSDLWVSSAYLVTGFKAYLQVRSWL